MVFHRRPRSEEALLEVRIYCKMTVWMMFLKREPKVLFTDVRIPLRHRDGAMSKHFLDYSDVSAIS